MKYIQYPGSETPPADGHACEPDLQSQDLKPLAVRQFLRRHELFTVQREDTSLSSANVEIVIERLCGSSTRTNLWLNVLGLAYSPY
jgi:hypothetical protein